jgi:CubicO group peptidase (beta-lactamase class C family)
MGKWLRWFVISLFIIGACAEEPIEKASEEGEKIVEQDSVTVPDTVSQDTASKDTTPTDTTSADTIATEKPDTTQVQDPGSVAQPIPAEPMYFPKNSWETKSPESLGWNIDSLNMLYDYLADKNTSGFIILHNGKLVAEKYWQGWNSNTKEIIASAGKSVTAFLIGLAQEEGLLKTTEKTSTYLGQGWSDLNSGKENLITLRHHLSMTTGLDETDDGCAQSSCFQYKADAGTRWAYHNAAYNLLNRVIEKVSNQSIDDFTKSRLAEKIGLNNYSWDNNILSWSTRDMARFGLLMLNKGNWNGTQIMKDTTYLKTMISSSSDFNKSYGYLWWLNGKASFMVPEDRTVHNSTLVSTAPKDMYAAMGKGDKKIYVVPSLKLVVVRHGTDTGESTFGPSSFDTELWKRLEGIVK